MEKLAGPVCRTWDEALGDPNLDLSKPWFVADPDAPPADNGDADWTGWTQAGATEEI